MAKKQTGQPDASHRVVLLAGPNQFLAIEHTASLREKLVAAHGDVQTMQVDGKTARMADVLDECRSLGLMQQHKLVVVDNAEELVKEANRPLVERYAQGPCEGATLVLRATKWYKGKLDEMIAAVGLIVECGEVSEELAARWIPQRAAKRHNATIDDDAQRALLERVGPELGRLDSELGKLAAAAGTAPGEGGGQGAGGSAARITLKLVDELVARSREESAWEWQGVLLSGSVRASLERLRSLIDVSKEPPQVLWWACLELTRKLHAISLGLKAGENEFGLTKSLKMWGSSTGAIVAAGKRMGAAEARRAMAAAVDGDSRYKSGLGDADRGLEMLTVTLTSLIAPQTRK
ncbi:MAG: DNA polymerase III subunit delta [Planctomycetota bacterium]